MKKLLLAILMAPLLAFAWEPTRPVTVIVGNTPGAGNEIAFRKLAEIVQKNNPKFNYVVSNIPGADLVVANDSGPLHLACALGRPVASPFLCTKIALTGPYGQLERAVAAPVACQGSLVRKCPTNQECMPALTPELFWNIIEKSLIGKPPWKVLNG